MKIFYSKIFLILFIFTADNLMVNSQWVQINSPTFADLYDVQFLNLQTGYIAGDLGKILKTTNGGLSWINESFQFTYSNRNINFINQNTGFISAAYGEVEPPVNYLYRTTDAGQNWSIVYDAGPHSLSRINFSEIGAVYFSITRCDTLNISKIFRGPAQGPWTLVYSTSDCGINAVKFKGNTGYAAGYNEGKIYKSTDYGNSWLIQNTGFADPLYEIHMFNKDTVLLSGANGKIFMTQNGGVNWYPVSSGTSVDLGKISFPDTMIGYIVTFSNTYLKSTDGGNSWRQYNTGFNENLRGVYFINPNTGYLVGTRGTILKTTNGGTIGVKNVSSTIPKSFELMQNYPNPFNPSTKIRFSIPLLREMDALSGRDVFVKVVIYDVLGREIQMLVNESLPPGIYEVDFNASNIPSGIYYYAFKSDEFTETRKMVSLK